MSASIMLLVNYIKKCMISQIKKIHDNDKKITSVLRKNVASQRSMTRS